MNYLYYFFSCEVTGLLTRVFSSNKSVIAIQATNVRIATTYRGINARKFAENQDWIELNYKVILTLMLWHSLSAWAFSSLFIPENLPPPLINFSREKSLSRFLITSGFSNHLIRNSITSKFQFHFFHIFFQHLIVFSFYNFFNFFPVVEISLHVSYLRKKICLDSHIL